MKDIKAFWKKHLYWRVGAIVVGILAPILVTFIGAMSMWEDEWEYLKGYFKSLWHSLKTGEEF